MMMSAIIDDVITTTSTAGGSSLRGNANVSGDVMNNYVSDPHNVTGRFGGTVVSMMVVIGSVGNFLVLAAIIKCRTLHRSYNAFIASLSATDLLFNITVMPFYVDSFTRRKWIYSSALCQWHTYFGTTVIIVSAFHIAVIALSRYHVIVRPRFYARWLSSGRAVAAQIAAVWVTAFAIVLIGIVGLLPVSIGYTDQIGRCNYIRAQSKAALGLVFGCGFLIPCGVMCYCYVMIWRRARQSRHRMNGYSTSTNGGGTSGTRTRRKAPRRPHAGNMSMAVTCDKPIPVTPPVGDFVSIPARTCWTTSPPANATDTSGSRNTLPRSSTAAVVDIIISNDSSSSFREPSFSVGSKPRRSTDPSSLDVNGIPLSIKRRQSEGSKSSRPVGLEDESSQSPAKILPGVSTAPADDSTYSGSHSDAIVLSSSTVNGSDVTVAIAASTSTILSTESALTSVVEALGGPSVLCGGQHAIGSAHRSAVTCLQVPQSRDGRTEEAGRRRLSSFSLFRHQMSSLGLAAHGFGEQISTVSANLHADANNLLVAPSCGKRSLTPSMGGTNHVAGAHRDHSLRMIMAVFLAYVVTYLPYTLTNLFDEHSELDRNVYMMTSLAFWAGSCVNPMIYGIMNRQFRAAYRSVVFACVRRPLSHITLPR